ncbi:MAG: NADH-quinone oxidoreductase subunit K [Acidilobaceae archaeon]
MESWESLAFRASVYAILIASMAAALYGVAVRSHSLSRIVAFSMLADLFCITIVFLGYRIASEKPLPPIVPKAGETALETVVESSVDPLVQCLVITALVVGLASLVLMTFLATQIEREESAGE